MHYSDPTANRALGPINREFSRLEKKAKQLCLLRRAGQLSDADWEKALRQFTGIYRHIPTFVMRKLDEEADAVICKPKAPSSEGARGSDGSLA